eukprot:876456-Prorocentrum_minimum.AAC.1
MTTADTEYPCQVRVLQPGPLKVRFVLGLWQTQRQQRHSSSSSSSSSSSRGWTTHLPHAAERVDDLHADEQIAEALDDAEATDGAQVLVVT